MYDPLAPSSGQAPSSPAWPASPHDPSDLPPHLSPSTPSSSVFRQQQARQTPLIKPEEIPRTQVYGQPQPSLMSPSALHSTNPPALPPFLRVKIATMERNRKDLLVRFDASTNIQHFQRPLYRNMQRSYVEFRLLSDQLTVGNPQAIVAALPLPTSSAVTDEEDDRLVRIALQRWFTRICEDPVLMVDDELRSFIESDFGYNPIPRPRKKTTSSPFPVGLPLFGKGIQDDDEFLSSAKVEVGRLDAQYAESSKAADKLSKARKSLAASEVDFGTKLVNSATTELVPPLGLALRKLGRTFDVIAGIQHAQSVNESVLIGDSLGYQSLNARAAKEALNQRLTILEEFQAAEKVTITKRRAVERMKASSSIVPSKVDDAIDDMEEAQAAEDVLSTRLANVSDNLQKSLRNHSRQAHEDLAVALLENARLNIGYERAVLRELESLRGDIKNVNNLGPRRRPGAPVESAVAAGKRPELLRGETENRRQQAMPPTRTWVDQPRAQPPLQQYQQGPPPPLQRSPSSYQRGAGVSPQQQQQQQQRPPQQYGNTVYPNPIGFAPPPEQRRFAPRQPQQQQQQQQQYPRPPSQQQQYRGPASNGDYRTSGESRRPESPSQVGPSNYGRRDISQSMYEPLPSAAGFGARAPPGYPNQQAGPPPNGGAFDPLGGLSGGGGSGQYPEQVSRGTGGSGMTQSFHQPPTQVPIYPQQPQRRRLDPREAASKLGKGF